MFIFLIFSPMKKMYSLLVIGVVAISGFGIVEAQESWMGRGKVNVQDISMMRTHSGGMSHSGMMMGSGMMHDDRDGDRPRPPRPPMGSGAMMGSGGQMERDGKGLMLAIGALSPADREALMKMIKDYLMSKGIDPAKYAEKRDEIKDMKKDMRDEAKDMRKATREEIQKKRDEMQAKIKEMRGNGKATFKEFTVTK
jgi:hypothetical protein